MAERSWSGDYRYGFNGKEKDDEMVGEGNDFDFGDRIFDVRLGRWTRVDQMSASYPAIAPYAFAMNTPISAYDPNGNLIIFIGGLRLTTANGDQGGLSFTPNFPSIYNQDVTNYWSSQGPNSFGELVPMDALFENRIGDSNSYYCSGSSDWRSSASQRFEEGKDKAEQFHAMVSSGAIVLEKDETIKIVCHSQGGANAAGFAEQLKSYKDVDGNPLYPIEVIYYITPHQPTEITNPEGIRGVQYTHPGDAIASNDPIILPNGGSEVGPIKRITEYDDREIMGGDNQPPCEGPTGNRCGHNVDDNDYIFDIPKGMPGHVAPRKDKPTPESNSTPKAKLK